MIKEVVKNVTGKVSGLSRKNVAEAAIGTGIGILAIGVGYVVCGSISVLRKRNKRIRELEEEINENRDKMLNNLSEASEIHGEYMNGTLEILENVAVNLDNLMDRVSDLEDYIFDGDYLSDEEDFSEDDYENDKNNKNNSKEDEE